MFKVTIRDLLWLTLVFAVIIKSSLSNSKVSADAELLQGELRIAEGDIGKWEVRAQSVAATMRELGIGVEFTEENRGYAIGPIPPHIMPPGPQLKASASP